MVNKKLIIVLLTVISLFSCQEKVHSFGELDSWLGNPDNGYTKKKEIIALDLIVQVLPSEYLAYNECKMDDSFVLFDTLVAEYAQSLTFLLTIGPNEKGENLDLLKAGVTNLNEFSERLEILNFELPKFIDLSIDGELYKPVLARMEDNYGLTPHRKFYVVFAPKEKSDKKFYEGGKIDFVFNDGFFNTGIGHFVFDREDIENLPNLAFLKKK